MVFVRWVFAVFLLLGATAQAVAADSLTAIPSSTEITADENVSLTFRAESQGMQASFGTPHYEAPDFDEVNNYGEEQGMSTAFINGAITVQRTESTVYVLHPRRAGTLKISGIQMTINGKTVRAADIEIEVHPSGTKLAQQGSGTGTGYPPRSKLPGGGVHAPTQYASTLFLRAEPSKLKVYKGEQVILTYALYTRVQVRNVQVERYPNPTGFLKEDIDIPLLRGRLDYTPAVVNGHEYRRAVLAQYAIYPLKDGTLPIDTFTAKFSFLPERAGLDQDDPIAMFSQFLTSMQVTTETRSSDRVSIEVLPLPGAGQPADFSGLVGDFDITAVADKTTVKAGEPINVKVKVEGKGHAGSLEHLPVHWPQDFELYEDKSNTQFYKTGQSERLFEYMVIPKTKGHFEIPSIELSMFNPDSHAYQVRKSQPIGVEVLEGTGGNVYVPKTQPDGTSAQASNEDIRYWKDATSDGPGVKVRAVARGMAMASMALAAMSLISLGAASADQTRQTRQKASQALRDRVAKLKTPTGAPVETLGEVESLLAQILDFQYGVAIGSLTRAELTAALTGRGMDEATAKRVEALVEHVESQRYAPGGGDAPAAKRAVDELTRLVQRIYS